MTTGPLFRVALLQLVAAGSDGDANQARGVEACRRAAAAGADLALFPEMWNIGYAMCPDDPAGRAAWSALAVDERSGFVEAFRAVAAEQRMAVAVTYLQRWDPAPRNVVTIIDRHGELGMTYAKVHTCDSWMERACTPGAEFLTCELDASGGPVELGAMICYDREFPESARVLMLQGAEVIVTPNSCRLDEPRLGQFRARAWENMVGVAMANYAAPQENGHSIAVSPIAYDEDERALDPVLVEAGSEEGVFVATFDLAALRDYRRRENWGDAYRKPGAYGPLLESRQLEVFRRPDARRRSGPVRATPPGPG